MPPPQKLDLSAGVVQPPIDLSAGVGTSSAPAQPAPEGFLHSLGSSLGITSEAGEALRQKFMQHPIREGLKSLVGGPLLPAAEGLYEGAKRSGGELIDAARSLRGGNPAEAAVHGIRAVPIVGPAIDKGADQYADHNYGGEAGTLLGAGIQTAPIVAGLGGESHFIPSMERSGKILGDVQTAMQGRSVPLTPRTLMPLEQAQKLSEAGHGTITSLDKLYGRSNQITPMDFEEARMRSSALGRLTGQDRLTGSNWLKGQAKQVGKGLWADTSDATAQIGMQPQFDSAMKEYERAARLNDAGQAIKGAIGKYAIPAAIGAGAAGTGYKIARHLKGGQ